MTMITAISHPKTELPTLLEQAVAAHANLVQVRLDGGRAVVEIMASGSVVAATGWPLEHCSQVLPATFGLCDGADDYQYGSSRTARMTGEKLALPAGITMVFLQFFPARDGQRHLVARLTYDSETCCGTCGG